MRTTPSLLLRYLLPVGLAREPQGDVFRQHAMFVSNVEALRRWLPHYVRVHAILAVMTLGLSAFLGTQGASWVAAAAAVVAAPEVCLVVAFAAAAIALRLL
jgi:hypothetical protein